MPLLSSAPEINRVHCGDPVEMHNRVRALLSLFLTIPAAHTWLTPAAVLAAFVLLPVSAVAGDFGRLGGYLSGGFGTVEEDFSGPRDPVNGEFDVDDAFTLGIRMGYRVHEHVAVESSVDYSINGLKGRNSDAGSFTAKAIVVSFNVKLYANEGRVQPFVMGGGVDIYLTENWALTGEVAYVTPTGPLEDLNFLSIGGQVMYRV